MRDFNSAPFLVIWETTQACDLACVHCRASAQPDRNPAELSTAEAKLLLHDIRQFGDPLMVFTGGDAMKRPDIFELLEYSVHTGLRTTITPSATPLLTAEAIRRFRSIGVARMAISIDGPDAAIHDTFRQVLGSFDRSILALDEAYRIGLETQVNTTVGKHNINHLAEIAELVAQHHSKLWSVFSLVPTGRAQAGADVSADDYERVFEFLYDISSVAPFDIKTTEAQHYRRYVAQRRKQENSPANPATITPSISRVAGINDGKGFMFISHIGDIFPSGFLPVAGGNVRHDSLVEVYRHAPLFQVLRDSSNLKGKCGECSYRNLCGGSRSRAFATTGDYLAQDPKCIYEPGGALAHA